MLGVVVPLDVLGGDLADAVAEVWRDSVSSSGGSGQAARRAEPITVAVGEWSRADVTGADVKEVLHALSSRVAKIAIALRTGDLLMLSGFAVALPESGASAVLVEPRGRGLTAAATALGSSLAYLADQTIGITPDGLVVPSLNPIPTHEPGTIQTLVAPSSLVRVPATPASYRVEALLVLEHDPLHSGAPLVEHIGTVDALAALAHGATALNHLERPLHRIAEILQQAGGAQRLTYSTVDTLEPVVREHLVGATS